MRYLRAEGSGMPVGRRIVTCLVLGMVKPPSRSPTVRHGERALSGCERRTYQPEFGSRAETWPAGAEPRRPGVRGAHGESASSRTRLCKAIVTCTVGPLTMAEYAPGSRRR